MNELPFVHNLMNVSRVMIFASFCFLSKDSMQGASVTLVWWHSELMFVARCSESISMQYAELSILCGSLGAQQL